MSDRLKPRKEWMVISSSVDDAFAIIADGTHQTLLANIPTGLANHVAEAHNAALAAEREQHNKELREYESALPDTHLSRIKVLEQQLAAEREKVHALVELLEQVLSETVDARDYPDGPCLNASTRTEIKDALAKVGK